MASGEERKYPADIRVKFPDTTALLASNITLECFALGKYVRLTNHRWHGIASKHPIRFALML